MRLFTINEAPQRSAEWFAARSGRLTGSVAADMMARIKDGEAAKRRDLRARLVVERLTGKPQEDSYVNAAMQHGIDHEASALAAYEVATGRLVERTGFLSHTELMAGCSLDGHVGDFTGIVEAKCPKSATHLRYLRCKSVPSEHLFQVVHNLWITGADWCDFVSFDPRFQPELQLWTIRVERKSLDMAAYELSVRAFLTEVEKEEAEVRELARAVTGAAA